MNTSQYIRLTYGNTKDYNGIRFSDGQLFDIYFDSPLSDVKIEHKEYKIENEDDEPDFNKKIMTSSLKFVVVADEWMYKLLNFIRTCDTKRITNNVGEIFSIDEMLVEGDITQGIGRIEVNCIVERITWSACMPNLSLNNNPVLLFNAISLLTTASALYIDGSPVPEGKYYILNLTTEYRLIQRINNTQNNPTNQWRYVEVGTNNMVQNINSTIFGLNNRYYRDSTFGSQNDYDIKICPDITGIVDTGTNYEVSGQAPEGLLIKIQKSPDRVIWSEITGTLTTTEQFVGSGYSDVYASFDTYIRLALMDTEENIIAYSNYYAV